MIEISNVCKTYETGIRLCGMSASPSGMESLCSLWDAAAPVNLR